MNETIYLAVWLAISAPAGLVLFGVLRRTLTDAGHVRVNFTGHRIPTSMGVGFAMLMVLEMLAAALAYGATPPPVLMPLFITVLGFALFGILDDVVVNREPGGFKGHISRLGAGKGVSTALLKAGFGLCLCLAVSVHFWSSQGPVMVIVNSLVIALSANAINLLDVRPGRAIKGFSFYLLFIFVGTVIGMYWGGWAHFHTGTAFIFLPFLVWAAAYAQLDFSCRAMLGDAGSNALGAVAGVLAVHELSCSNRWILLALLAGFHLLCEATSLTSVIDSVPLLKKLDTLGIRPAAPGAKKQPD